MKKKIGSILSITIALIFIIGISYAYFIYNATGKHDIVFNGGKINIAFTTERVAVIIKNIAE